MARSGDLAREQAQREAQWRLRSERARYEAERARRQYDQCEPETRLVAREREIPVFDRLAIMRHWSDTGVFDLYAATKDITLAKRVHDCIGRALATMIIEAAHLGGTGPKDHPKENKDTK